MNLINLINEEEKLLQLALNEEIDEKDFFDMIDVLGNEISKKGVGYIKVMDTLNNQIDMGKAYKKEIDERIKKMEKGLEKIKKHLIKVLEINSTNKITTPLGTISIRNSGTPKVEVIDENIIPRKYFKIIQSEQLDKKAIIKDFKENGEIIDGIDISYSKSIIIK